MVVADAAAGPISPAADRTATANPARIPRMLLPLFAEEQDCANCAC